MKILKENKTANNKKYILYTSRITVEFDTFTEAETAYKNCTERKFLYQPEKTYFLGTLVSTGKVLGLDNLYHRRTVKCKGLFISKNKNQIKTFLEKVDWHPPVTPTDSSKVRLYKNGTTETLYQSNLKNSWEGFNRDIFQEYLTCNIYFDKLLEKGYGAIDVGIPENVQYYYHKIPYQFMFQDT